MSLGVVPLAMSVWKPEIAPQAMVMKQNGNTLPARNRPEPSVNRVSAGIFKSGSTSRMPKASAKMVPSFMNVLR